MRFFRRARAQTAAAPSLLAIALAITACSTATPPTSSPTPSVATTTTATPPAAPPPKKGRHELHVLLTTDEHGWLLPLVDKVAGVERGGILALYDRFTRVEGYVAGPAGRDAGWLLMSAGDMWTGPYESTVLEGAPLVAAMSHMGYAAAAVGNHEFDFGTRVLAERSKGARFPLLAANLIDQATGMLPDWAKPFVILDVGGIKLGVVGLTNVDSPVSADPRHMTGLAFRPYADALEEWLPRARAAGADELFVLMHDSMATAPALVPVLRKHRVRAVGLGHQHTAGLAIDDGGTPSLDDDIAMCNAGAFMRSYCRIDLRIDDGMLTARDAVIGVVETPRDGERPPADPKLAAIVAAAEKSADEKGGEVLVDNVRPLTRGIDGPLGQLVVDAWLDALPYAHAAVTNAGGLRQDLPAGPVRIRDVVSVLPFNNTLLVVDLTGKQLKEVLASDESIASGVTFSYRAGKGGRTVLDVVDAKGNVVTDDAKLKVVINDFMYRGGDRYRFRSYDAEPEETAIDWREPVFRRLRDLKRANLKLDVTADDRAKKRS